ncbi:MAG: succinate dehydrogenase cytochrome b subunit [Desulfobacterales bacterium]|jgi:succinate dehydrogenase / fumarate reductase cytochrome b subunit
MNWLFGTLGSSIGKKLLMAITGLGFCGFLTVHLAGNLTIYGGKASFNSYSEQLHALEPLVTLTELGLLVFAIFHISIGAILFYQNLRARPVRYAVNKSAGGRSLGSRTMPYTGILLLAFVIFHLINFHFVDKTGTTLYEIVSEAFENPVYVILYVIAVVVAAVHISHGFWSAFQTLGANHPKYMPFIRKIGIAFSLLVGIGFSTLPVYLFIVV